MQNIPPWPRPSLICTACTSLALMCTECIILTLTCTECAILSLTFPDQCKVYSFDPYCHLPSWPWLSMTLIFSELCCVYHPELDLHLPVLRLPSWHWPLQMCSEVTILTLPSLINPEYSTLPPSFTYLCRVPGYTILSQTDTECRQAPSCRASCQSHCLYTQENVLSLIILLILLTWSQHWGLQFEENIPNECFIKVNLDMRQLYRTPIKNSFVF